MFTDNKGIVFESKISPYSDVVFNALKNCDLYIFEGSDIPFCSSLRQFALKSEATELVKITRDHKDLIKHVTNTMNVLQALEIESKHLNDVVDFLGLAPPTAYVVNGVYRGLVDCIVVDPEGLKQVRVDVLESPTESKQFNIKSTQHVLLVSGVVNLLSSAIQTVNMLFVTDLKA